MGWLDGILRRRRPRGAHAAYPSRRPGSLAEVALPLAAAELPLAAAELPLAAAELPLAAAALPPAAAEPAAAAVEPSADASEPARTAIVPRQPTVRLGFADGTTVDVDPDSPESSTFRVLADTLRERPTRPLR
jgi:hypothetical protein